MKSREICTHFAEDLFSFSCEELGVCDGTFAQMPTPILLGDVVRVFFTNRNNQNKSTVYFIDLDKSNIRRIVNKGRLDLERGDRGTFDHDGVMCSSVIEYNGTWLMFYVGWDTGSEVPYRLSIGLAESSDSCRSFRKVSSGPVIDRSIFNPYFVTTPDVKKNINGFVMSYSQGMAWQMVEENPESHYVAALAFSSDLVSWSKFTQVKEVFEEEMCIARPVLHKDHLYYSKRPIRDFRQKGRGYRIVLSRFLIDDRGDFKVNNECRVVWNNSNESILDRAYAYPIEIDGKTLLFYNGDEFGKQGFQLAVID